MSRWPAAAEGERILAVGHTSAVGHTLAAHGSAVEVRVFIPEARAFPHSGRANLK
jgi:hypothetical protein